MTVKWNDPGQDIDLRVGQLLGAAGAMVASTLKQRLSNAGPPAGRASVPGEYPHYRTLNLRESVVYQPTDVRRIAREGQVRVGYTVAGFYGAILELARGRKGLRDVIDELRGQLARLAVAATVSRP